MLVIADGQAKTVCSHPRLFKQGKVLYCPDCDQRFNSRTKVYRQFMSDESCQTCPAEASDLPAHSKRRSNQPPDNRTGSEASTSGQPSPTGTNRRRKNQTRRRHVSNHKTPRTHPESHSADWNASPQGIEFWCRVDLVWLYLTDQEKQSAYFQRSYDYPRQLEGLECAESRRQLELPISHSYQPYDSPRECTYRYNDDVSYPAIAYGERRLSAKTILIRIHYRTSDDQPPRETDANSDYVQWPQLDPLTELEQERDRLIKEAEYAPDNGWIETGKVQGKSFKQAWWRGKYSQGKKTIYIGKVGSAEYLKARNAQKARKQLKKVLRQIEQLKKG